MKSPWSVRSQRRSSVSPAVLVTLAGVVVATILLVRLRGAESQLDQTRDWTRSVLDSLGRNLETPPPPVGAEGRDSLYWQWVAIGARIDARRLQAQVREARARRGNLLGPGDLAALREAGLDDPATQLRDSLVARSDLAPFKDPSGARRAFPADRIILLGSPYVFAYADNGKNGGFVLLAYDVRPGPRVRWRKLWWAENQ